MAAKKASPVKKVVAKKASAPKKTAPKKAAPKKVTASKKVSAPKKTVVAPAASGASQVKPVVPKKKAVAPKKSGAKKVKVSSIDFSIISRLILVDFVSHLRRSQLRRRRQSQQSESTTCANVLVFLTPLSRCGVLELFDSVLGARF